MAQGSLDCSPTLSLGILGKGIAKAQALGQDQASRGTWETGEASKEGATREPGARPRWSSQAMVEILYKRL